MPQAALGNKHTCSACDSRFYDLGKSPVLCPKCGQEDMPKQAAAPVIAIVENKKDASLDAETGLDLAAFDDTIAEADANMPKGLDAVESFDMEDDELESLSELENREIHEQQVGHDDTADEEELIDTMKDGGLIVDEIEDD